jgi:hypothetical protein
MNQSMQPVIQHLFQVSGIEGLSRERLEAFVEEYPCFGFGHYLLSRKLKAENAGNFLIATQRTGLYFPNPFWLEWMLEHSPGTAAVATPVTLETNLPTIPTFAEPSVQIAESLPESVTLPELETAGQTPAAEETSAATETPSALEIYPSAAELLLDSIEQARELRESLQKINEDYLGGARAVTSDDPVQIQPVGESVGESAGEPVGEPAGESTGDSHPPSADEPIHDEEPPFILAETDPEAHNGAATADIPRESLPEVSSPPAVTPAVESMQVKAVDAPIFEPFHTIDYFASQGIKLTLDENPTDVLGRQLKSFTDWLKVMRRLPQKEREIVPDRVAEQTIQSFAAHSIEGKEVVTETMAEVLAMQGMRERARIVYEKLSLLNPDKSAYFATKIEQLNIS